MKINQILLITLFIFGINFLKAQTIIINEVMSSNYTTISDEDGDYSDWIEIYNSGNSVVNLNDYSLSDDANSSPKWIFPNIEMNPDTYLIIFASGKDRNINYLHTNFKISADGEMLWLRDSFGNVIDSLDSVSIPTDYSLGRNISDPSEWLFYENSTPGSANESNGIEAFAKEPILSLEAGFYNNSINLEITSEDTGAMIYYTTDGSNPNVNSNVFISEIIIDITTVVKAISTINGLLSSKIISRTYFINEETTLPVFSISTDPANLWDDETGIYADGTNGISGPCSPAPKNYNQDWERPVTLEFFENNKMPAFNMNAGVKIYGGCSRTYPLKSLAIYARRKYGYKSIDYPLFPELPYSNYEAVVLRNSGDDYYSSYMRDGLMHSIVSDLDLEKQAFRQVIVFLNGEYWGIHNLREKINENFLAQHHNVDPDNLDILEREQWIIEGDANNYNTMISFIANNDITNIQNYAIVEAMMDIENFITYCVSQIYFDNTDWPGHNIKYWRSRDGGKWRWILFDTDFGFGFKSAENYKNNTLEYATDENGTTNANPSWSTFLLRKLLENDKFREKFINTYADYANSIFKPEIVNSKIISISETVKPEIPRHIEKWGELFSDPVLYSIWLNNISVMKNFADNRLSYLNDHFINEFGLYGTVNVSISSNISGFGKIKINSLETDNMPWNGTYFIGNPIILEAVSKTGYNFIEWRSNGLTFSTDNKLIVLLNNDIDLVAHFEPDSNSLNNVVINEINYNSSALLNTGDWLELKNISQVTLDLSNWYLTDENTDNKFIFPSNLFIKPGRYLVIAEDSLLLKQHFPESHKIVGNINFKISNKGETLNIFDHNSFLIDSVKYGIQNPWPDLSNGTGNTIELSSPDLDNSIGVNWHSSSVSGGTPGRDNSTGIPTSIKIAETDVITTKYEIFQNYPNPFNPSTSISYSIPNDGNVTLSIYDLLGNEVALLENGNKSAGNYTYNFDASNLSSGLYFYTLRVGASTGSATLSFTSTKKMLLMK